LKKRHSRRQPSEPVTRADMVTPELRRQHVIADAEAVHFGDGKNIKPHRAWAKRNLTQRPIDQYHYQHNISDVQYMAADRFWSDWYYAGLPPRLTANLMGVGGGGAPVYGTDRQQAARNRLKAALMVLDMYDQGFVIDVVCHDKFLGGELMKNRITIRTRFDRLRSALDRLARHYGIG